MIVNHGRILTCRRPGGGHLPGVMEFPGGKIEPGETPGACVVREAAEETGLTIRAIRPLEVVRHTYPDLFVELHFWLCEIAEGEPANPGATGRWVRPDELRDEDFPPANAPILARLRRGLVT